jgi:hypothetical protein
VAAGGSERHCARVPGDASGWAGADPARSSGRSRTGWQGSAVGGVGGVGPERAADDAGRDSSRVAPQRVCDCVASAGEASCGCVGLRVGQGSCRAGGAGRVPVGSTQPGRTAPYRPQPRRTRITTAADNAQEQRRLSWSVRARARPDRAPGSAPRRGLDWPGARARRRRARGSGSTRLRPTA